MRTTYPDACVGVVDFNKTGIMPARCNNRNRQDIFSAVGLLVQITRLSFLALLDGTD